MTDDLIVVFEAETLMEAQLVSNGLEQAGIQSFIDNTDSPLDGLISAGQLKLVRVLPKDAQQAKQVVSNLKKGSEETG